MSLGDAIDVAQAAESAHKHEPHNVLVMESQNKGNDNNGRRGRKNYNNHYYTNSTGPRPTLGRGQYYSYNQQPQNRFMYPRPQGPGYGGGEWLQFTRRTKDHDTVEILETMQPFINMGQTLL